MDFRSIAITLSLAAALPAHSEFDSGKLAKAIVTKDIDLLRRITSYIK